MTVNYNPTMRRLARWAVHLIVSIPLLLGACVLAFGVASCFVVPSPTAPRMSPPPSRFLYRAARPYGTSGDCFTFTPGRVQRWECTWDGKWYVAWEWSLWLLALILCGTWVVVQRLTLALAAEMRADRIRRLPSGICHGCQYDLTGNVSGVCPECGTATPKD